MAGVGVAVHHLHDVSGHARVAEEASDHFTDERVRLGGLLYHGIARRQRGNHVLHPELEREIPGQDATDHADGLADDQGQAQPRLVSDRHRVCGELGIPDPTEGPDRVVGKIPEKRSRMIVLAMIGFTSTPVMSTRKGIPEKSSRRSTGA